MARILIGNIKGPRGPQGIQGIQGPVGPQGPQGPLPPLINNFLATEAGVGALDAVAGATLKAQLDEVNGDFWNTAGRYLDTSILEKAVSINSPGLYTYVLSGESYSGGDLPSSTYAYGCASVFWRNSTSIAVVLYGASSASPFTINRYTGTGWAGWEIYVRNSDFRFDNINKYVLDWGDYGNGTHQLKSSIVGKSIYVSVGTNGRITDFWGTSAVGDYRDVIIPDGVLSIHIDSETQITVSGTTPKWMLRGIVTL